MKTVLFFVLTLSFGQAFADQSILQGKAAYDLSTDLSGAVLVCQPISQNQNTQAGYFPLKISASALVLPETIVKIETANAALSFGQNNTSLMEVEESRSFFILGSQDQKTRLLVPKLNSQKSVVGTYTNYEGSSFQIQCSAE